MPSTIERKPSRLVGKKLDSRLRSARLSDGQINLLKSHGYRAMSERKIRVMKRAHAKYLASAQFRPNAPAGLPNISLEDAEKRVERYLESLSSDQ